VIAKFAIESNDTDYRDPHAVAGVLESDLDFKHWIQGPALFRVI